MHTTDVCVHCCLLSYIHSVYTFTLAHTGAQFTFSFNIDTRAYTHTHSQVRVAAFAVSSYALAYYRAGRKPFNPILGETYEWIREDKGFKFIAEQVCSVMQCNTM